MLVAACADTFCPKMKDFIENNKENGEDFSIIFNYNLLHDIGQRPSLSNIDFELPLKETQGIVWMTEEHKKIYTFYQIYANSLNKEK